jgi:nitrite reductase/ring-hydroxylating ferredoxin subunit
MAEFVKVARVDDVPPDAMITVDIDSRPIVLANVNGTIYAFDGLCTHAGGPLGEGLLIGDMVECPFHGGQFDVRTGAAVALPAFEGVPVHEVRIDGNDITVARP